MGKRRASRRLEVATVLARKQRGAYAVEFAFSFLLFFMLLYGIITYGLIYTTQQSLNLAAQDLARYAQRWPGAALPDDLAARGRYALTRLQQAGTLAWLQTQAGAGQASPVHIAICGRLSADATAASWLAGTAGSACPSAGDENDAPLQVLVSYDWRQAPLVPDLAMGLLSWATPAVLRAHASARVSISQRAGSVS